MSECQECTDKKTVCPVKNGVQCGGAHAYCQNTLPNQQFCDSAKTILEEIQWWHAPANLQSSIYTEVWINW